MSKALVIPSLDSAERRELRARVRLEPWPQLMDEFGVTPDEIRGAALAPAPSANTTPVVCGATDCGEVIERPSWATGRPRRYCSDVCRVRESRRRNG
jgi:hypothetical protein